MIPQPEALRLADALDNFPIGVVEKAAAELRRLHELNEDKTEIIAALSANNQELLEALKQVEFALSRCVGPHKAEEGDRHRALAATRAAIAKAEEKE